MRFLRLAILMSALCVVANSAVIGDDKAPTEKQHGQLPANWSKLGLTDEQKNKIYAIQNKCQAEVDKLKKQISDLEKNEKKDREAVLTAAQKEKLREIMAGKAPAADTK